MRTRVRNQFPRRREIHVDDDVDARARVPSSPSPTPTLARARRSSSTRTPLAPSRDDDTEASNGIRRRARAPTREIAARARACSSPLLDESRIDRDTRRDRPPIAVGKGKNTRGDSWTGHDRWRDGWVVLVPPVAETASAWDGRSRARADVIDEGVVEGS